MNQDDYIKIAIPGIVGFLGAYLLKYIEPVANTILWNPHSFTFAVENLNIATNSVTVQNLGRKAAENIEIIYQYKPDSYKIWPERIAEAKTNDDGTFIILLKSLGRKEYFSIESLHYQGLHPEIVNARTKEGPIKTVKFNSQRAQPQWKAWTGRVIFLIGIGTIGYWTLQLLERY